MDSVPWSDTVKASLTICQKALPRMATAIFVVGVEDMLPVDDDCRFCGYIIPNEG